MRDVGKRHFTHSVVVMVVAIAIMLSACICEQEADGEPPHTSVRDGDGNVLARWPTRHAHGLWVDSRGDIYLGLTTRHSVDKYVRTG